MNCIYPKSKFLGLWPSKYDDCSFCDSFIYPTFYRGEISDNFLLINHLKNILIPNALCGSRFPVHEFFILITIDFVSQIFHTTGECSFNQNWFELLCLLIIRKRQLPSSNIEKITRLNISYSQFWFSCLLMHRNFEI